ncbi:MAG: response regulator [Firmicutes bacterium]|nr:response regulator [Bacillota bacterium]
MKEHTILVVDDNRTNLQIIRDILESQYHLLMAVSGEAALKFLQRKSPDLILLDLMMPGMSGQEVFQAIRQKPQQAAIPVIFLTANQDSEVEVECLNMGASDFITKPIVPEVLCHRIRNTLELRDLQNDLEEQIRRKTVENERLLLQAIEAIVYSIEAKDTITQGHSVRVAGYCRAMARELGYDEDVQQQIYQTALLHDVGKIGTPDAILKKTSPLNEEEYRIIQKHTTDGASILSTIGTIPYLEDGARYHHEHYDGSGYPQGLAGDDIPLIGRIIAVADVYDALISRRHYKDPLDQQMARKELMDHSGTQFDPGIVQTFIRLLDLGVIEEIQKESER